MSTMDVLTNQDEFVIKVGADTAVQGVARSIRIAIFDEHKMPVIRAIGASAVNQGCKGIAIARGFCATQGFDLGVNIGFVNLPGEGGGEISALNFFLFLR